MDDETPKVKITEYGFTVPTYLLDMFTELRSSYSSEPATEEDRLKLEQWRELHKEWCAAREDHLAKLTDPVVRALLDLHKDEYGNCEGCDSEGYESEYPSWPCRTTLLVLEQTGLPEPKPPRINYKRREIANNSGSVAGYSFGFKANTDDR